MTDYLLSCTGRGYTTATAFFEALWDVCFPKNPHRLKAISANKSLQAGVSHIFVNLGSDHPAIIEAIVQGQTGADAEKGPISTSNNLSS